ncbi:hypothetical protein Trydic_g8593 [Trypoxylus dichotomus]
MFKIERITCSYSLIWFLIVFVRSSALNLSIIHINDFHARFDETSPTSTVCKNNSACIGGFSRIHTVVNQLYRTGSNPISLNAGDNFQGTTWYSMFKWNVTQFFLNMLPTDAMVLGNHEFDDGIEGLVPFLKRIEAPVVVCNINDTLEPDVRNLYRKSVVIEREGRKIGIVGVLSSTTKGTSYTGKLSFLDEIKSTNAEAQRLLQQEDVFTVIVLSHCGYELEKQIARQAIVGISLIVGGHSNTLLYNGTPPFGTSSGQYPTVIESIYNRTVLIVQADGFSRYVGNLSVEYDNFGNPKAWEGNPIYLDTNIPQNKSINDLLEGYRIEVEKIGQRLVGKTNVHLDQSSCLFTECNLGNLVADAMVAYYSNHTDDQDSWTKAAVSIINSGAFRSSIYKGDISLNDLENAMPFGDRIVYGVLQGKHIKTIMESSAAPYFFRKANFNMTAIQVSGMKMVVDLTQPIGSRIVSLKIRCRRCHIPAFQKLEPEEYYPIALTLYLAKGGDRHGVIQEHLTDVKRGPRVVDIVSEYISKLSPIILGLDDRIIVRG